MNRHRRFMFRWIPAAVLAVLIGGCARSRPMGSAPELLPEPVTSARSVEVTALLKRGPVVARLERGGAVLTGRPVKALLGETVRITITPDGAKPVTREGTYDKDNDSFRIVFDGLPDNALCRYTVTIGDKTVGPFHFLTPLAPGDPTPFCFAAYGDTQGPWQIHKTLADRMLSHGSRFVLHAGDLCGFFDAADPSRDLRAHMPMLWTKGNHDFGVDHRKVFDIPKPWFSFECGSVRVLSLSCFEDWKPGSEQYTWFRKQVERPWDGWTILLTHAPPFTVMGSHLNYNWIEHVFPLALKGGVDLIICGHEHNYVRSRPIALEPRQRGMVEIVTGGGGGNMYGYVKELPFITYGRKQWHYMFFDVTKETLTGRAVSPEGNQIDSFVLRKDKPQTDLILAPKSKEKQWRDARAVRLPRVFRDGMVLQRGKTVPVWGWAPAGADITVTLEGKSASARAGDDGRWQAEIAAPPPGGPYKMTVEGRGERIDVEDVLVGDVWFCAGDGTMAARLRSASGRVKEKECMPRLRVFTATQQTPGAIPPLDDAVGRWVSCTEQETSHVSAVAYAFGRELQRSQGVPIGLIVAAQRGQRIEPFISREGFEKDGPRHVTKALQVLAEEMAMSKAERAALHKQRQAQFDTRKAALEHGLLEQDPGSGARWFDPATDVSGWRKIEVPKYWDTHDLAAFDGAVWLRRDIQVPEDAAGREAVLELSRIDDIDVTWLNGKRVGATGMSVKHSFYVPRKYAVPAGIVRAGKNTLVVRVADMTRGGGIWDRKVPLRLTVKGCPSIPLAGVWKYRIGMSFVPGQALPPTAPGTWGRSTPSAAYGSLVAPFVQVKVRGFLWQQGEANAAEGFACRTLMRTLIRDWRRLWGAELPFVWAQMGNFRPPSARPSVRTDLGPELREAQLLALAEPATGMAVTVDIGESRNIHPRNKQDVGRRLALAARAVAYGEKIVHSGPVYRSMAVDGNRIRLRFDHVGGGLMARGSKDGALKQFYIAGKDRKWVPAKAKIDGDTVVVWSNAVAELAAVRYAWLNDPIGCNLYNREGLPASPFRTDDWPLQSQAE